MSSLSTVALPANLRPVLGARATGAIAAGSLAGLVALSFTVVLIAADRPSFLTPTARPGFFPAWMAGPLRGLWPGLTSNGDTLAWLVSALMGAMYVLYIGAFLAVPRIRARWTIAALLAIHLIFLLAPPLSYTDVFNYINYGRMGIVHHLNPYTALPAAEPRSDPAFGLSNWHHLRSPYGPLFTLLSYVLVPLGVPASFWALKLIVGAASLATLALVWKCARRLGRSEVAAVVFVGANPIVLIWGLGADHNDSLMLLFVVLAVFLALHRRAPVSGGVDGGGRPASLAAAAAGVALMTAIFIKASAAVLLPLFLVAGGRRWFLAGSLLTGGILAAISVIAFGYHLPDLSTQSSLVTAVGLPNLFGLALGLGGETAGLSTIFSLTVALAVAACTIRIIRRPGDWIGACAVAMLVLVVSLSWAAPWYLLWVLPLAALSRPRGPRIAALVVGGYFILAFMPAASRLAGDIHFRPQATPLGIRHTRAISAAVG